MWQSVPYAFDRPRENGFPRRPDESPRNDISRRLSVADGGEIAEAPPAAEEARRFRGSAPAGGHDNACLSAGTTVGRHGPRPTGVLSIGAS